MSAASEGGGQMERAKNTWQPLSAVFVFSAQEMFTGAPFLAFLLVIARIQTGMRSQTVVFVLRVSVIVGCSCLLDTRSKPTKEKVQQTREPIIVWRGEHGGGASCERARAWAATLFF